MTAPEIREAFKVLRELTPAIGHELLDVLERRLILAEALVALYEKLGTSDADVFVEKAEVVAFPGYSVKVI